LIVTVKIDQSRRLSPRNQGWRAVTWNHPFSVTGYVQFIVTVPCGFVNLSEIPPGIDNDEMKGDAACGWLIGDAGSHVVPW